MCDSDAALAKVIILNCSWNAHESLQEAGRQHLPYPAGVRPLKVDCLGQISASLILKALEKGADGVMLVGCSPEECHYEFGSRRAAELFDEVRRLAVLLGFRQEQLAFYQIHAGQPEALVAEVRAFVSRLSSAGQAGGRASSSPRDAEQAKAADAVLVENSEGARRDRE